ncbi:MAG: type II-A CRISPR-associated protein Csn2 [Lachnospiraceae bacterium]|nr:type II-A CRISPR-associated protein Csn2 [Lachnospiraceae bacterium]MBR4086185.1 type II-A CRISPR-associated protein Csn2 [Lachnospiraceae bacterium]
MYNVHFDFQEIDLLEKVLNYMQLEKTLCGTKLIVFINFKSFFDKEQIREIYINHLSITSYQY